VELGWKELMKIDRPMSRNLEQQDVMANRIRIQYAIENRPN